MTDKVVLRGAPYLLALCTVLAGVSQPASAGNCYQIVDRNGELLYQGVVPPVDLEAPPVSNAWAAMRQRGDHLLFFDSASCPAIVAVPRGAPARTASVDDILVGVRDVRSAGGVAVGAGGVFDATPAGAPAYQGAAGAGRDLASKTTIPGHYGDAATVVPFMR